MAKSLQDKIEGILKAKLENYSSGLETTPGTKRIMGFIVSSSFRSDHHARQKKLGKILDENLEKHELDRVGPIVTMTPEEAEIHEEVK